MRNFQAWNLSPWLYDYIKFVYDNTNMKEMSTRLQFGCGGSAPPDPPTSSGQVFASSRFNFSGWTSGRLDVRTSRHLDVWTSGRPDFRTSARSDVWLIRTSEHLDVWTSGLRTSGHLDVRTSGRPDVRTSGRLDVQPSRRPGV